MMAFQSEKGHAERMRRWLSFQSVTFLLLAVLLLYVGRTRLFRDPGTFWHTVVGEEILTTGIFPQTDHFSFTFSGQPWIAYHWLSECAMAMVHGVAGLDGLLVVTVIALAWLYSWIAARWHRAGFHWSIAVVGMALAMAAGMHNWHVRPHLFSLALLAVNFAMLVDVESGRRSLRSLWWLAPLFLCWTNLHGGTLGGLATTFLVFAGWMFNFVVFRAGPSTSYRDVLTLCAIAVTSVAMTVVTPYGVDVPRFWLLIMSLDLPDIIQEHAPLNPRELSGMAILALGAVYLFVLAGTLPRRPRITWLIPLVWLFLAWGRNRHGPLFAVVATLAIADVFPFTRWARALTERGSDLFQLPADKSAQPDWRSWVLPILASIALCGWTLGHRQPQLVRLDPGYWPIELLPELEALEKEGNRRICNRLLYGGYLIYFVPGLPVFIDDRCELYGNAFLREYSTAEHAQPERLEDWVEQYGLTDALVQTHSPFDQYLRKARQWELVKETRTATLYRRKAPIN